MRLLRSQLAQTGRHRLGGAVALLILLWSGIEWLSGGAEPAAMAGRLQLIAWCAVWSVSGTLGKGEAAGFRALTRLRGKQWLNHPLLTPAARSTLAFTIHGTASAVFGLLLLSSSTSLSGFGWTLFSCLLLLTISLLFCAALGALSVLTAYISERHKAKLFWLSLILPWLLQPALFELPSLMDWVDSAAERALSPGAP